MFSSLRSARTRLAYWRQDRDDQRRAGAWARGRAIQMQQRFIKRTPFALVGLFGPVAVFVIFFLLAPPAVVGGVLVGIVLASTTIGTAHLIILHSGSTNFLIGETAEQTTADVLRPLRREGYRMRFGALLSDRGDIDAILLGPAGLIVLETRDSSKAWEGRYQRGVIETAAAQVRANARQVGLVFHTAVPDLPVYRVIVLWSPTARARRPTIDDVEVMPGATLLDWIRELPVALDHHRVETGWSHLREQLKRRDAAEHRPHASWLSLTH